MISSIIFSSVITPSRSGLSVCPSLIDEKIFSVRGLVSGFVDTDITKLVSLLVISGIVFLFFIYCCSLNRMSDLHSDGGFPNNVNFI